MEETAMDHVLLFATPAQGHMPPMLKLAELISDSGLHVTFVNTENIDARFLRSSTALQRLSQRPKFRFRTIPDGLPKDHPRPFVGFLEVIESMRTQSREPFRELLAPVSGRDTDGWPPVTCVLADGVLPCQLLEVPEEVGISLMILRTSSPASIWTNFSIPELIKRGEIPRSEEADMDELLQGVPGMGSFLRRRDLHGFLRITKSLDDPFVQYLMEISNNASRGQALILNAVEELEIGILPYLHSVCPVIYAIGPLQLLQKSSIVNSETNTEMQSSDSISLWLEDRTCLAWLNSQAHKSVVYVSFGSVTIMSTEAFVEFWNGLINSSRPFLWVIRPDMVQEGTDVTNIVRGKHEKARFVDWAPQEEVLAHPAIGCFLTHCGWNSTIESMIAGVPMICWPFFADQQVNSRFVSEIWKVGVDIKDTCDRSVIESAVRKVMDDGEESKRLRRSARETAKLIKVSVEKGGSSYTNFQKLIQHIKLFSSRPNRCSSLEPDKEGKRDSLRKSAIFVGGK